MTNITNRNFFINVDEDKIFLASVEFDSETMLLTNTLLQNMFDALSSSPSVIDISNLNYMPNIGDVWDGSNFINENGISSKNKPDIAQNNTSFSFLVNGVHSHYWTFMGNADTNMTVAALKSNPTITFEDVNG